MGSDTGRVKDLGSSLPVENVQELASKNLKELPPRYLRPELESDHVSVDETLQIPVIDKAKLGQGDQDELAKLHFACTDWGFFQLINHGVVEEVIENMKIDIQEFFKLPLEEKMVFAQVPDQIEGYGQAFVVSEEQKLDWGDMLFLFPQPVSQRDARFWPTAPSSFRESLDKYSWELQKLTIWLLRLMGRNLGTDEDEIAKMFEEGVQGVRMNYYPACKEADKVMGLTPHSDATGLTLLIQVNEVQGLQVKKDDKWVPIKPIPGGLIINIGDIIEIMSNGQYKSIEHRAVVNNAKERLSIAAFHSPNIKTKIGPLPHLVKKNGAHYRTVSSEEFIKFVLSNKLDGKNVLDHFKLGNL